MAIFEGTGVALLTLFDDDGRLLSAATSNLARQLHADGIAAFLIAGTCGEFFHLEDHERVELVARVRADLPATATVVAHVGGVPGERAEALAGAVVSAGANAVIALPPDVDDRHRYYNGIVAAVPGTPVMAYHLPQLGAFIELDQLASLGVSAVKDSEGDLKRLAREVEIGLEVYTGAPTALVAAHELGAPGVLVGLANSHPETCIAAFGGDPEAQALIADLEPASLEDFPANLKKMTSRRIAIPVATRGKS
jgi:4-hydroxy-tetrahydrodipicolinate synthase